MLLDARSLPNDGTLEADVCIIGAGPAGITLALELARTDLRVLVLESGDAGWTTRGKGLARGENADPNYFRLEWARIRTFGGSSWAWRSHGLRTRPLDRLDFEARPEIDRPGWPIGADALAHHWDRATALCRLPSRGYDVEDWQTPQAPALSGDDDLDTAMFPVGPGDAFTSRLDELGELDNVTCVTHATVLELQTDASGRRVERAWVTSGAGRSHTVSARTFALALGGIENARLLLLSHRTHRHGIGNAHDLVGRHFMEHPHIRTGVLEPRVPARDFRLYQRVEHPEGEAIGFLRPSEAALRREGLLNSAWALHPATPELTSEVGRSLTDVKDTLRTFWRVTPHTGARVGTLARHPVRAVTTLAGSRDVRRGAAPTPRFRLLGMTEQEPHRDSRVVLGTRRDRYGQPVARLDWRLTERDLWTVRRTQEVLSAALERAGVGRIVQRFGDEHPPPLIGGGFHHMGTTRMDRDPRAGVVDTDGRVHDMANLYVAGSSVFPTGGVANPTLTLLALTLRLADHLRQQLVASRPTGAADLTRP